MTTIPDRLKRLRDEDAAICERDGGDEFSCRVGFNACADELWPMVLEQQNRIDNLRLALRRVIESGNGWLAVEALAKDDEAAIGPVCTE